jgi:hypothetical protein
MTKVRSLKNGPNANARRLLEAVTGANSDPTATTPGINMQGGQFLHLYAVFNGGSTQIQVTPWWYSEIAEQWFPGNTETLTPAAPMVLIQAQGEHRVYLRVNSVTGGNVDVWGGYSFDEPGREG